MKENNSREMYANVVVCGGGPAGIAAAISSARTGAKTLLIEKHGSLGGIPVSGILSVIGPLDDGDRLLDWERDKRIENRISLSKEMMVGNQIIGGITREIVDTLSREGAAIDYGYGFIPVNPEVLKRIAEEKAQAEGVEILYETLLTGAVVEEGRIKEVLTAGKSGSTKIGGDVFIDATGDGDLSFLAGAPYEKGRETDGRMQGVTLVFRLGGVKMKGRFFTDCKQIEENNGLFEEYYRKGKTKSLYKVGCINVIPGMKDVVSVNTQHTHFIDGAVTEDVTRALIAGRREIEEITGLFRRHLKGFEDAFLLDTASMLGVRETRRIRGRYVLTSEDVLQARDFQDGIGRNAYDLDIHLPDESTSANWDSNRTLSEGLSLKPGTSYGIPYRCLIPEGMENLLVAGRCISATHRAQSSVRIIPCCMVTGQAAGIAGALSSLDEICPSALDAGLLRKTIKDAGGII